jgi:uncharacterized protein (TIRG00374 family)
MNKKKIRILIGLGISALFLYLSLRGIQWNTAWEAVQNCKYEYVLPALIVYLIALWVRAYRWTFLLPPGVHINTPKAFPILMLGCFANNILPLRMGDLYRAYILGKKENISKSSAFASIFVDKVFDALAVLTFLGVAAWALSSRFPEWEKRLLQSASVVLLGGVVALWLLLWNREWANKTITFLTPFIPEKFRKPIIAMIHNFLDGLNTLKNHKLVVMAFIVSLVSWSIEALMYHIFATSMGVHPPLYASAIILAVVNLAMMIPASPAGVGTFEFFAIKTAMPFFPSKGVAASYSILVHLGWFIPVSLIGLYYLWKENLSLWKMEPETTFPAEE